MVNISLLVVDIKYRNKCSHSKSPLQVLILELMAKGLKEIGRKAIFVQRVVIGGNQFGEPQFGGSV